MPTAIQNVPDSYTINLDNETPLSIEEGVAELSRLWRRPISITAFGRYKLYGLTSYDGKRIKLPHRRTGRTWLTTAGAIAWWDARISQEAEMATAG